jgi:hypothetical protein
MEGIRGLHRRRAAPAPAGGAGHGLPASGRPAGGEDSLRSRPAASGRQSGRSRLCPEQLRPGRLVQGPARLLVALLLLCAPSPVSAQALDSATGARPVTADITAEQLGEIGFRKGDILAVPIPFRNALLGNGLALGAGYLFTSDAGSAPSFFGIAGFKTENDSEAYGAGVNLSLDDNRWQLGLFAGKADINYDFPLGPIDLPFHQTGRFAALNAGYGVTDALAFGVTLRYLDTDLGLQRGVLPDRFRPEANLSILSYGLTAGWDRRDDTIYPTDGFQLSAAAYQGDLSGSASGSYRKGTLLYDLYHPIGASSVVAGRLAGCAATPEAPFFDSCSLGGTDAFRGYSPTDYIGDRLTSVQVALRSRLNRRFGLVVFAGTGTVAEQFGDLGSGDWHSAAGIGGRIRLSKSYPLDYSIDLSWNDEHEEILYLYVGQRF